MNKRKNKTLHSKFFKGKGKEKQQQKKGPVAQLG